MQHKYYKDNAKQINRKVKKKNQLKNYKNLIIIPLVKFMAKRYVTIDQIEKQYTTLISDKGDIRFFEASLIIQKQQQAIQLMSDDDAYEHIQNYIGSQLTRISMDNTNKESNILAVFACMRIWALTLNNKQNIQSLLHEECALLSLYKGTATTNLTGFIQFIKTQTVAIYKDDMYNDY